MRLKYTPAGGQPQSWEFEPNKLMSPEAELIERQTGWGFVEWGDKLQKSSFIALHALLFVLLKRGNPILRWEDVVFSMSEIDFVYEGPEIRMAIDALQAKETLTAVEQKTLDDLLLQEMADGGPKEEVPEPTNASSGSPDSPLT